MEDKFAPFKYTLVYFWYVHLRHFKNCVLALWLQNIETSSQTCSGSVFPEKYPSSSWKVRCRLLGENCRQQFLSSCVLYCYWPSKLCHWYSSVKSVMWMTNHCLTGFEMPHIWYCKPCQEPIQLGRSEAQWGSACCCFANWI